MQQDDWKFDVDMGFIDDFFVLLQHYQLVVTVMV